jgi:hypothetical protein
MDVALGQGVDPRMSNSGGHYGQGAYFAENLCYVTNTFGHWVDVPVPPGHPKRKTLSFLICSVAVGDQVDLKTELRRHIVRPPEKCHDVDGIPVLYDSIKAGPHKAGSSSAQTIMHVVYEQRRHDPTYLVQLTVEFH